MRDMYLWMRRTFKTHDEVVLKRAFSEHEISGGIILTLAYPLFPKSNAAVPKATLYNDLASLTGSYFCLPRIGIEITTAKWLWFIAPTLILASQLWYSFRPRPKTVLEAGGTTILELPERQEYRWPAKRTKEKTSLWFSHRDPRQKENHFIFTAHTVKSSNCFAPLMKVSTAARMPCTICRADRLATSLTVSIRRCSPNSSPNSSRASIRPSE